MQFLTGKRIILGITGLLIVLVLAGWFLFGPNLFNYLQMAGAPPGSTIDAECAVVYQKVMVEGFGGGSLEVQPGFKIEKALFISGQEAKSRYDFQLAAPDDARMCYVLVEGYVTISIPLPGTVSTPFYSTAHAIYDLNSMLPYSLGTGEKY